MSRRMFDDDELFQLITECRNSGLSDFHFVNLPVEWKQLSLIPKIIKSNHFLATILHHSQQIGKAMDFWQIGQNSAGDNLKYSHISKKQS